MQLPATLLLVIEPVDMRLGIDGLSSKIQLALQQNPCDGTAYAFRNRASNRIKLLCWDGTGSVRQRRSASGWRSGGYIEAALFGRVVSVRFLP